MDSENIFNTKKAWHISFQLIIWILPDLPFFLTAVSLHRGVEWV